MGGCIGINRNSDNDVDSSSVNVSRQTTGGYNILQYFLKVKYYNNNNNNNLTQHHHHHFFNPLGSSIPFPSFTYYFKSFSISYVHTHTKTYVWSCRIKRTVSNLKSPFNCYRVKISLWLSLEVCGRTYRTMDFFWWIWVNELD